MTYSDILSCRTIIVLMVVLGYINQEMLRVNLNIAIVDMIEPDPNDTVRNVTPPYKGKEIRFRLTESQKHHLLFAFFWGYMMFDVIGGYFLDMMGPRKILGFSIAVSGLVTAFTPLIGLTCGYYGLLTIRAILGLTMGGIYPSALPLAFNWIAKDQKHKFLAILSCGSLGGGLSFSLFGFMIAHYGWASVFYFTSAFNALFCILWFYLIYDTPKQHPRISLQEKRRILAEVDASSGLEKNKIPWRKFLFSKVIWSLCFAYASGATMYFFTIAQLPYYMNQIHGMNIGNGGLVSSLPLICRPIFAFIFGYIADRMIRSKSINVLTVRRIFASIKLGLEPTCFILLGFFGDSLAPTIALFILAFVFGSAVHAGVNTTMLDVAPSFSGTITTISNSMCSIMLIGITELLAYFTKTGSDFKNFRKIFFVLAAIDLSAWILFMLFANTKTKRWNFKEIKEETTEELKQLNKTRAG